MYIKNNNNPSVMDVDSSRTIVEDYIRYRLDRNGLSWQNGQRDVTPYEIQQAMRALGDEFESRFSQVFDEMMNQLHITPESAHQTFITIVQEIFKDGVNWGRVVTLFGFGGKLAVRCVQQSMPQLVCSIVDWVTTYVDTTLKPWIAENNGWAGFLAFYEGDPDKRSKDSWPSFKTICSYAAAGLGILTLGAFLSQKSLDQGSEIVDNEALRLKCTSEEADSKKLIDATNKDNITDNATNDDDETLEIDCYLKHRQPALSQMQTLTVNMLHAPVLQTSLPENHSNAGSIFPNSNNLYNFELHRLGSYLSFPHSDYPGFVSKLSGDGFIFKSGEDVIECYFCRAQITMEELRRPGFDVVHLHSVRSPNCPFKLGASTNVETPVSQSPLVATGQAASKGDSAAPAMMTSTTIMEKRPSVTGSIGPPSHHPATLNKGPGSSVAGQNYTVTSSMEVADCASLIQQPQGSAEPPTSMKGSVPHQSARVQIPDSLTRPSGNVNSSSSAPQTMENTASRPAANNSSQNTVSRPAADNARQNTAPRPAANSSSQNTAPRPAANNPSQSASTQQSATVSTDKKEEAPKEKKKLTYSDLGIFADKPKRPDMAILSKRLASFEGKWKATYMQTPQVLAEAGMYYAGYSDCARCFCCGGGLKNWAPPDNPWVEHARWFPKCAYVSMAKGPLFVEIVKRKNQNKEDIKLKDIEDEIKTTFNKPLSIDAGANQGRTPVDGSSSRANGQGTNAAGNSIPVKGLAELKVENEELKSQICCKICMDFDSAVVFLPCGHLVACTNCAIVLKTCPLCRSEIKGSVRAYLS